ncbi:MAG: tetratricopeptide repeat protein [Planctomycetota bacterium]|nr:tetratricopeptide repeat protein [Planctomycetota bacterium]
MADQLSIDQAMQVAVKHHLAGRLSEAEAIYNNILSVKPNYPYAIHNLAEIGIRVRQYPRALVLARRAMELDPDDAAFNNTLGAILFALGQPEESLKYINRALEINPKLANAYVNLGIAYADQARLPESISAFEQAIKLDPQNANGHDGLGLSSLMHGDLQRGWREQEWRWHKYNFEKRRYSDCPQWDGADLKNRTIFLPMEQGHGDLIHFCRYAPLLTQRGAKVVLEVTPEQVALMKTLKGVEALVPVGETPPPFDVACPMMSVPLWYGTTMETIPAEIPYLSHNAAIAAEWEPFFRTDRNYKIGIAWAGRPTHANDHNRSTSLAAFAPLADIPGTTFYSLQKGDPAAQIARPPKGMNLIHLGPRLDSFEVTGAVLQHLDLLISIDTSVVHLAGALGRPVWNLLAFCPDWRWLLNRSDTPWYPTMRLFRCPSRGDWTGLFANVREALAEEVARKRPRAGIARN